MKKARFKIIDVVGARPQFIKVAAVARELSRVSVDYLIVNTGQHYDDRMSQVFFDELEIQVPAYSLGVGSGSHAEQTARMIVGLEEIFLKESPDLVQVYGDTNSTIAAALAAAKLMIPVSHVESGLRSFNREMPEEINRITTDHLASLLFVPCKAAVAQLKREGITRNVHWTGDVMLDVLMRWKERGTIRPPLQGEPHVLATIHRAENTDHPERLRDILEGLGGTGVPVLLPIHPRLRKMLGQHQLELPGNFHGVEPLSYFEMMSALHHCSCVVTDSGGLQKEAFFMGRRCVTIRDETEWKELTAAKVNQLAGTDPAKIIRLVRQALKKGPVANAALMREYGQGKAAGRIASQLLRFLSATKSRRK